MAILTISSRIFLPHLNMVAACVDNMSLCEDFSTYHKKIKGNASPLVGGIKVGDDRKMQGKQHIEEHLAAELSILIHGVAACLLDLASRTFPSLPLQVQPQGSDSL